MAKRKKKRPPKETIWGAVPSRAAREAARQSKKEQRAYERKQKRLRAEEPGVIELKTMTRWRSKRTGKLVPFAKRKGSMRELVQVQVNQKGRIIRTTGFNTKEEVRRTVVAGLIEETGTNQGLVGLALDRTNIMSPSSLKGARKILVKVSGTDPRGERASFKFDIDYPTIRKRRRVLRSVLLGSILYEMRARSWRTWYRVDHVDWSKVKYGSKSKTRQRVPMRDVEIVVRVMR